MSLKLAIISFYGAAIQVGFSEFLIQYYPSARVEWSVGNSQVFCAKVSDAFDLLRVALGC